MRKLGLLSVWLLTSTAFAALPPAAESLRRIKVIIESKEVYEQLDSADWVKSITQTTDDAYMLQTTKCQLFVNVSSMDKQPSHPRLIGPRPLMVNIQKKECR